MIERDRWPSAIRYGTVRKSMTPNDQFAVKKGLFEPLARVQAANDVDRFLPPRGARTALLPQPRGSRRCSAGHRSRAVERNAQALCTGRPWRSAARCRGVRANRREDVARDSGFAIAEQLGSRFTSIAQLPAAVRRDLDEEPDRALRSLAQANLDPTSIAAGGEAALMMSIIASEDPAAFAKEDLRLIQAR